MIIYKMQTSHLKEKEIQKKWWIVDLKETKIKVLGRLATKIATVLRGKHKTTYTPHLDCGDNVIVINADQIEVTGDKRNQKIYYRHSGYIGHLRQRTLNEQAEKHPESILREAVKGMIRRTTLRRYIMKHLFVYMGEEHPHSGQTPQKMEI